MLGVDEESESAPSDGTEAVLRKDMSTEMPNAATKSTASWIIQFVVACTFTDKLCASASWVWVREMYMYHRRRKEEETNGISQSLKKKGGGE